MAVKEYALGALPPRKDIREYRATCAVNIDETQFPEEFELPMPKVKNQGQVGSCVAHGVSETIEYFNKLQEETDIVFSTGYIYGNRRNSNWKGEGMYMDDALDNAVKYGDVPNSLFNINVEVPEAINKFEEKAFELSPNAIPNRISSYFALRTDAERKLNLMQNGPIVFSIEWFTGSYIDKKDNDLLKVPNNAPSAGYHCMVIYGWNKYGWKFQNSWGTTWGNKGRGVMPYTRPFSTCYGVKDEISEKQRNKKVNQLEVTVQQLNAELAIKDKEFHDMSVQLAAYQQELEEKNAQIAKVRELMDSTKAALDETKMHRESIYIEINNLEASIEDLRNEKTVTESEMETLVNKVNDLAEQEKSLSESEDAGDELVEIRALIEEYRQKIEVYDNKILEINNNINYSCKQIFEKREAASSIELEISKLEAQLNNNQLDYEEAFRKLNEVTANNVELGTQYQAALKEIKGYAAQLQEQQEQIEFLQGKILEIEKPFSHLPKFIVHIVNWFLNLFNKNK